MELRLMSAAEDRSLFARNLVETRMSKGAGFSETRRSQVGEAHLAFGQLYALFDPDGANPEEMIAGFVAHDLGTFPQSYPRPDLTHFPPEAVLECGELWAKLAGSARMIRQAAWILAGQLKTQAILLYPLFKPWNLSIPYRRDFECAGDPIEWPYIRTLEGEKMLVQPMVSSGAKLTRMIDEACQWGFRVDHDLTRISFTSPFTIGRRRRKREQGRSAGLSVTSDGLS
jgi:hypothetical protein